jgi:hypothetical protein
MNECFGGGGGWSWRGQGGSKERFEADFGVARFTSRLVDC